MILSMENNLEPCMVQVFNSTPMNKWQKTIHMVKVLKCKRIIQLYYFNIQSSSLHYMKLQGRK